MNKPLLAIGIDLGTSGVRLSILDESERIVHYSHLKYKNGLAFPTDWKECCEKLIKELSKEIKDRVSAISVDGTSGTLIACKFEGEPLGQALPYNFSCPEKQETLYKLISNKGPASSSSGSLGRAIKLIEQYGEKILLRHQADWINGWLLGDWRWGEEANNLKMGWILEEKEWPKSFANLSWRESLPNIVSSGTVIGTISKKIALELSLPKDLLIVAGTTDSNAAVLAANPNSNEGVTILGSTLVLKRFTEEPINAPGVTNHRVVNRWLCGGSSNTGGAVLKKFFDSNQLNELSRQINPNKSSGISLRPLPSYGERFPVDDPTLRPILEPRPVSDSLYLHALLEGIARIESKGWKFFLDNGLQAIDQIITIGGGAENPQWRRIRERIIGLPIRTSKTPPSAGVGLLALKAMREQKSS